jgi:hypothetical protein
MRFPSRRECDMALMVERKHRSGMNRNEGLGRAYFPVTATASVVARCDRRSATSRSGRNEQRNEQPIESAQLADFRDPRSRRVGGTGNAIAIGSGSDTERRQARGA